MFHTVTADNSQKFVYHKESSKALDTKIHGTHHHC